MIDSLTPKIIVEELDKYIIGQEEAKKAVAIALRNRWRRQQVTGDLQKDIVPNNIILIGPTGVGKTEIARRISRLVGAPFIKVEASKFTEIGYVGRDVESMVRELMNMAVNQARNKMLDDVTEKAYQYAIEKITEIMLQANDDSNSQPDPEEQLSQQQRNHRNREILKQKLLDGLLDDREIEVKNGSDQPSHNIEILSNMSFEMLDFNLSDMIEHMIPSKNKERTRILKVPDAIKHFQESEANRLVNKDKVIEEAKNQVQNNGIIFIDELDKIASSEKHTGVDVSRSGVQRDLLPIIEGSNVPTKYGMIDTTHILFIAAGAFHSAKPSDLIPELQGRFPIRVELKSLTASDFEKILVEPENALTKQYEALFKAENSKLKFSSDAIQKIAYFAAMANDKMEDIGARRLHTILNNLLESFLYDLPNKKLRSVVINSDFVIDKIKPLIESEDLSKFIL